MNNGHTKQKRFHSLSESERLIVHLAAEAAPFLKKGGLGDILESLPQSLSHHGWDNVVILPFCKEIGERYRPELIDQDTVLMDNKPYSYKVYSLIRHDVHHLFVQLQPQQEEEKAFAFDHLAKDGYATYQAEVTISHFLFGKVVADFLGTFVRTCVLFTHDWHVGAVYPYLKGQPTRCHTFHVIHNYHHQGHIFTNLLQHVDEVVREDLRALFHRGHHRTLSALAIEHADQVLTVSPHYAAELQSEIAPHPQLSVLRGKEIIPLLNGIHSQIWNPVVDTMIQQNYSAEQPEGKRVNKQSLIETYRLDITVDEPITVLLSRLTLQKGIDLLIDVGLSPRFDSAERMEQLLDLGGAFLVCGTPEGGVNGRVDRQFQALANRFPRRFLYLNRYSEQVAHELLAGADLLLHPSRFEPCGLTHMHALAYGTLPIVTRVGGLVDTVVCLQEHPEIGFGLHMHPHTFSELYRVLQIAYELYRDKPRWNQLVTRAMQQQNGWEVRIEPYLRLIESAFSSHKIETESR